MSRKSALTRKANMLAGARPPLPGQSHYREASLRAELSAYFEPDGPVEIIWVADIAYCMAASEVTRVQIAGFRMLIMEKAYLDLTELSNYFDEALLDEALPATTPKNWARQNRMAEQGFISSSHGELLGDPDFAALLGRMSAQDARHLHLLEQMLSDQTKERDRIINQIDRRRRQAMRDAIEQAEACRRAEQEARTEGDAELIDGNGRSLRDLAALPDMPGDGYADVDEAEYDTAQHSMDLQEQVL